MSLSNNFNDCAPIMEQMYFFNGVFVFIPSPPVFNPLMGMTAAELSMGNHYTPENAPSLTPYQRSMANLYPEP